MICTLRDPRVPALAATRHHALGGGARICGGTGWTARVVAIGNAPTALFRLLEMLEARRAEARRDHRHAGRLRRRRRIEGGAGGESHGVPYLIVHGRMGGSAMAAAAVNALARAGL